MNLKQVIRIFLTGAVALFFSCSVAVFISAAGDKTADQGAEKATQEVVKKDSSGKMIDLSNPEEALDPDKWVQFLQVAKDWLIANGPGILIALAILVIGRWLAMWFAAVSSPHISQDQCKKAANVLIRYVNSRH